MFVRGDGNLFSHTGGVLFKIIDGLITLSDLVLKNKGSLHISPRFFGAGYFISCDSRPRTSESLIGRQNRGSISVTYVCLKAANPSFTFLY